MFVLSTFLAANDPEELHSFPINFYLAAKNTVQSTQQGPFSHYAQSTVEFKPDCSTEQVQYSLEVARVQKQRSLKVDLDSKSPKRCNIVSLRSQQGLLQEPALVQTDATPLGLQSQRIPTEPPHKPII